MTEKQDKGRVLLACTCLNQHGKMVIEGVARVIAPREKVRRPRVVLPEVHLHTQGAQYAKLIAATEALAPVRTAVVHPCDALSLIGALDAAHQGMIVPVLVGPKATIDAAARAAGRSLDGIEILDAAHSHAAAAAAVALVRAGKVAALMKGSLHTDELMEAVVDATLGLRTERRMSHVYALDVPTYPKPLLITDAAINIYPDLISQARHRPERDRPCPRARDRAAQGRDPLGGRDGQPADLLDARCGGAVQDGRPGPDHRRADRRAAGL